MTRPKLSVGYAEPRLREKAERLALQLGLPLDNHHQPQLLVQVHGLALLWPGFKPLAADFSVAEQRIRHTRGKPEGLIRACKPAKGVRIVDATAGWGRDAALLAACGAEVTMLERHPVMHALLEDALMRVPEQFPNLQLVHADALSWLDALPEAQWPDVIYLDPMHPTRKKSALVQKDMQMLQSIIGYEGGIEPLITLARKRCIRCVVVKWPQHAVPLLEPSDSVAGKTVRFDRYIPIRPERT